MTSHTFEHPIALSPRHDLVPRLHEHVWAGLLLVLAIAMSTAAYRAIVTASPAVSAIEEASPPDLVTSFSERRSHNGRYSAEIVEASPVAIGTAQSWTLHLSRRARRVSHATVVASAWMPDDGMRSPAVPTVRYVGGGDYRIENLVFTKAGWWNVALVIDGKQGTDSLAFNVVVPPAR